MTLYEIDNAIREVLENAADPETGELVDEELLEQYDKLIMDRDQKVENIGLFIKNLEADADAIRTEANKLLTRARACDNKAEHLRNYLQYCLNGQKFRSPRLDVSFRHSKKVEVSDMDAIPMMYLRYKAPEVNRKMVADEIKAGGTVPGCELVENVSMIIK